MSFLGIGGNSASQSGGVNTDRIDMAITEYVFLQYWPPNCFEYSWNSRLDTVTDFFNRMVSWAKSFCRQDIHYLQSLSGHVMPNASAPDIPKEIWTREKAFALTDASLNSTKFRKKSARSSSPEALAQLARLAQVPLDHYEAQVRISMTFLHL